MTLSSAATVQFEGSEQCKESERDTPIPFNRVESRRRDIDALDQAIVTLSRKINADNYQRLVLVREFDERAGWLRWG